MLIFKNILNKKGQGCACCEACSQKQWDEGLDTSRRGLIKWTLGALPFLGSVLPAASALAEQKDQSAQDMAQRKLSPQPGDRLTYFSRRKRGKILTVADLTLGKKQTLTLPISPDGIVRDKNRYNQILVQRLDPAKFDEESAARSADGIIAYSAICPHNGCPVTGWQKSNSTYMCPCHQSVFDPQKSAAVLEGPAPRALPALPIKVEEGQVLIAGDFTDWVGFGQKTR